jgi:hypothetical protein
MNKIISTLLLSMCCSAGILPNNIASQLPRAVQPYSISDMQERTDIIKLGLNLCDPSPAIRHVVEEALQACEINEPVIILQDENVADCVVHRLRLLDNVFVVVVGVKGGVPLPFIKWSMYHECAHIVYGDLNSSNTIFKLADAVVEIGAGCYAASQSNAILQKTLSKYPRYLVNALAFLAVGEVFSRAYHNTIGNYFSRIKERRADLFAAQTLIHKQHDITSCAMTFINFKPNDTCALFNDHPSDKERAEIMLKEFKKADVDFEHLPLDVQALEGTGFSKERLQELFIAKIRRYFPEYLKN